MAEAFISGFRTISTGEQTVATYVYDTGTMSWVAATNASGVGPASNVTVLNTSIPVTQAGTWNINAITSLPAITGSVSVSNFPATQAISVASLPLPSGAATETTLAAINTKTPALGQALMAASSPVVIASNQSALPVTGTFWQATQPVSIASMPSTPVTGTFWQATQPVSLTSTTITGSVAATQSGTWNIGSITTLPALPTGANTIGAVAPLPNVSVGPTAFTAFDAVVAAPVGDGTLVSGASTSGSIVSVAIPSGFTAWTVLIKNWTNGTIYSEASFNSTNGTDGDWVEVKGRRTGTAPGTESVVYALVANGYYRGNGAGFTYYRLRFIGASTFPTATVTLTEAQGATFLNSGIPGGSSVIGKVGIDQTTPGTTNLVSIGTNGTVAINTALPTGANTIGAVNVNGTVPVSGTFWQATQPVSLASTTITGSVAVTGPLTDTQLRAAVVPVSLASTAITGSVAVTGPLTDTQLRAAVVPVSLASTTITGSVAVTGPLTDTQLRAAVVPVSLASTTITGSVAVSNAPTVSQSGMGYVRDDPTVDVLAQVLIELRVMNSILHSTLNSRDELDALRQEIANSVSQTLS